MEPGSREVNSRLAALAAFVLLAVAVGATILAARSTASLATEAEESHCRQVEAPKPRKADLKAPAQSVIRGEKLTAAVKTSCGTFDVALDTARAPKTVNSFAYLAKKKFYDGLTFHRIAPDFVIQGGDPLGNGTGGPGYAVTEKPPAHLSYTRGTVAMAKSSSEPSGRSGSQFFVVTARNAGLPPEYALLGRVSRGYYVVKRIESLGTLSENPRRTVLIEKIRVEKG